jgi:hypothetical protein
MSDSAPAVTSGTFGLRSIADTSPTAGVRHDPRTRLLLEAPITRTLLLLAAPNVLVSSRKLRSD